MQLKKFPIVYSIVAILVVYLVNKIPLSDAFQYYGLKDKAANTIEDIVFNGSLVCGIYYLMKLQNIALPFRNFVPNTAAYYIPIVIYLFVFSGGLNNLDLSFVTATHSSPLILLLFDTLSSAFLEEMLFRALILGLLISKYHTDKNGIFKSVMISSLMFGFLHVLNLWTNPDASLRGVLNQIYAATCIGFMYSSIYLKTKNILPLSIAHFLSNFFASINTLSMTGVIESPSRVETSMAIIILTEIIRLIIFGLPLLIGLIILTRVTTEDIKEFLAKRNSKI